MAISSLEALLSQKKVNSAEIIKQKLYFSRLGGEVEFSFRRLSYDRYKFYRKQALDLKKGSFDIDKYRLNVVLTCLVDPDLSKTEFLKTLARDGEDPSVINPETALPRIFLAGEIVAIADMIQKGSGFADSDDLFRGDLQEGEGASEEQ